MTDDPARSTALAPADALPATLDAHGFDPADYDWIPVRRVRRRDGWSEEKQRAFIGLLADTGCVAEAAAGVGMTKQSAYAPRRAPDAAGFDRAWTAATRQAMNRLLDVCLERAIEGSDEPILGRDGRRIGGRRKYHDRMAMFLLRAHMPDLFRPEPDRAHRAGRARGETPPPPEPVAEAVKAIDPVTPAAPHALMSPEALDVALQVADLMEGRLPHWRRDRDLVRMEEEDREAAAADAAARAAEDAEEPSIMVYDDFDADDPPIPPFMARRQRRRRRV